MRWLLFGCWGLAWINISAALQAALLVTQKPRFYGLKTSRSAALYCQSSRPDLSATVHWYKTSRYNDDVGKRRLLTGQITGNSEQTVNAVLFLKNMAIADSGVYFCKLNDTWGPGTELQVARPVARGKAVYRSKVKDGLIILQGLLLALLVAAVLQRKHKLWKMKDTIYEEPETEHIYEGLAIETCEGGLYEELSVYAEADGAEAPWE